MSPPDPNQLPEPTRRPRRRTLLLSLSPLLLAGGVLSLPAVHWSFIGWWHGEAFFQGRPTSYWSGRVREWNDTHIRSPGQFFQPPPSSIDRLRAAVGWSTHSLPLPAVLGTDDGLHFRGLGAVSGQLDEQAIPVLLELFRDEDEKVRRRAVLAFALNDTADRRVVPAVVELWQRDESPVIRSCIAHALYRLDPESPVLAELLGSQDKN